MCAGALAGQANDSTYQLCSAWDQAAFSFGAVFQGPLIALLTRVGPLPPDVGYRTGVGRSPRHSTRPGLCLSVAPVFQLLAQFARTVRTHHAPNLMLSHPATHLVSGYPPARELLAQQTLHMAGNDIEPVVEIHGILACDRYEAI